VGTLADRQQVLPQLLQILPKFHKLCYNLVETPRTYFVFLLENCAAKTKKATHLL